MGTLFRQNIVRVPDVPTALQTLSAMNRRTFAAALDRSARQLTSFPVQKGDCVVIGNEGHGLRPETVAAADACVYIPMTDRAESLNAAVAAALFMWEFYGKTDRADNGVGE
jgi:TrmH family RNA methyltransferase